MNQSIDLSIFLVLDSIKDWNKVPQGWSLRFDLKAEQLKDSMSLDQLENPRSSPRISS